MHGEPTGMSSGDADTRRRARKRTVLIAIGASALVLVSTIGLALVLNRHEAPRTFIEVYVTDLPADFSRFDVRVARVEIGTSQTPLELDNGRFDLLQLQGPGDALRLARGYALAAEDQEIRIVFESGELELDHKKISVEIPDAVLSLGHDYGLEAKAPTSILFDIDLNESLVIDGPRIRFEPYVASVYIVAQGAVGGSGDAAAEAPAGRRADFTAVPPEAPRRQSLEDAPKETEARNPFATVTRTVTSSTTATATTTASTTPTTTSAAPTDDEEPDDDQHGDPGDESDGSDWMPNPSDVNNAPDYGETVLGYFIQYAPDGRNVEEIESQVKALGAEIVYRFESMPALYVAGEEIAIGQIANNTWVQYVEPAVNVTYHLSSTKQAIRSAQATDLVTGLKDAQGRPIDGRGLGVAVVDTGIDGLHPDLTHFLIDGDKAPVRANFKVVSNNLVDMPYTDTTSGHGTHVSGIVAGRGTKDPSMKGVAPGAKLYGMGIGEISTTFWPNQAFDWIVQHGHKQNPPIKVVTNSWGTAGAYDPNSLTTKLVNQMVAKGMVVVFSVSNEGGDGSEDHTSAECKIPTPGVICVAWYDDMGGSRNGLLHSESSRGLTSDPSTWPDISAPGSAVRSARTPFGWVTGVGLTDYYVTLQGSSMSAPHVAGTAALMLQANPGLSPAQVESIIKQTAYKYDLESPYAASGSHYGKGHGLLDTYTAVQVAKTS